MSEEKILKSALLEFAEFGFDGARVDRIAKRAGINKAMIYYHFKGKEKLYERIIGDTAENIKIFIASKMAKEPSSVEDILDTIGHFIEYMHSLDINFFRIVMREISSGGKFFKKIFLPNTLVPFVGIFLEAVEKLKKNNKIADINALYAFFQLIGSALYFNLLRIALKDTDLYSMVFHDGYLFEFIKNYKFIALNGLQPKKGGIRK
jgi:AcrR family transcriptional regulator